MSSIRRKLVSVSPGKPASRSSKSTTSSEPSSVPEKARWTFLTNHSHVLILLSQDSSMVLRAVAAKIGITERAVQRIIAELEEGGFIERQKIGRQNHYRILSRSPLRHPIESHRTIGDLLELIGEGNNKNNSQR